MAGEPKMEFQPKKAEPSNEGEGEVGMTQEEYNIKSERDFIVKQISKGVTEIVCILPLHKENAVVDGYRVIQTGGWDGREVRVEKI